MAEDPPTHLLVRVGGREAVFGTGLPEVGVGSDRGCLIRLDDNATLRALVIWKATAYPGPDPATARDDYCRARAPKG